VSLIVRSCCSRVGSSEPGTMMPELGRSLVHAEGLALLTNWIARMDGRCRLARKRPDPPGRQNPGIPLGLYGNRRRWCGQLHLVHRRRFSPHRAQGLLSPMPAEGHPHQEQFSHTDRDCPLQIGQAGLNCWPPREQS
jgi:hypothetical protein